MKALGVLAGIAAAAMPAWAQTPAAQPLLHLTASFDLVVHLSYARTAPLFGPQGERAWAGKHWDPQFIHPLPPHDEQGAVFTIQHGAMKAVWINTLFDVDARHFQYVYFLPEIMVTVIDVRFKPLSADATGVNIVYTRTALTSNGNEHVTAMNQDDKSAGSEWQAALDTYLVSTKINGSH